VVVRRRFSNHKEELEQGHPVEHQH